MQLDTKQNLIWEILEQFSSEEVIRYFTCFHGTQLLDEDFLKYLITELELTDDEIEELESSYDISIW